MDNLEGNLIPHNEVSCRYGPELSPKQNSQEYCRQDSSALVKFTKSHDHNGICRCCLSHGKFESMEWDNVSAGRTQSYLGMLRDTLGLSLSQTTHPRLICSSCAVRLGQTLAFREQVVAAEKTFLEKKLQTEIKFETEPYEGEQSVSLETTSHNLNTVSAKNSSCKMERSSDNDAIEKSIKLEDKGNTDVGTGLFSSCWVLSNTELIDEIDHDQGNASAQQNGLIMCEFCSEIHVPDEYSQCRFCNYIFSNEEDKVAHVKCDTNHCTFCEQSFLSSEEKIDHMKVCKYFTCFLRRSIGMNETKIKHKTKKSFVKNKFKIFECDICKKEHTYRELVEEHKKYRKLTCTDCRKVFTTITLKRNHRKFCTNRKTACTDREPENALQCKLCKVIHETKQQQENHFRNRHLTCPSCYCVFPTKLERDKHWRVHKMQCEVCNETFTSHTIKLQHVKSQHGVKCRICGVRVLSHLKYKHDLEFHRDKIPQCGICNFICKSKYTLDYHQRKVHMKEKNTPCPKCDFVAFDAHHLNKHMLSHSNKKNYQCDYCHKKFVRRNTLNFHVRIHTGDKRAVCKICGDAFVQRASLKYHLEKHHPGDIY